MFLHILEAPPVEININIKGAKYIKPTLKKKKTLFLFNKAFLMGHYGASILSPSANKYFDLSINAN